MADPTKAIKGGLSAIRNASRAADQALEAKRLALEAANPPIKASEAYGQHEGAYMKPIFYDRMRVDLSKGKKGGPGFSGIQLVDPNYADAKAAAGVTDQKMATRILNRNKAGVPAGAKVIWTPSVGGLEQHKSNSTMFGEFADIFANQRKNMSNEEIQKLSDRASNAVDNKGKLIFPNGIDLGSRNFRQQVKTYDQRGLMADIFAGRGVGGEKGRTVPVEELLEKNIDPNVANAGTLDLGNRLFRLEGDVIDRPDLHSDYRKILTGEDLGVNYIPVPIREVYSDWEAQKALDLAAQGKNRGVTLMDYTKNDPTVQLTEELLTKMQKAGKKSGGAVNRTESPADMARFHKRFAMHKAIGGRVSKQPVKMAEGGRASIFDKPVHMVDGGKVAKGLMGAINKAEKAADAAIAAKKTEAPSIIIPSKVSNIKEAVRKNKGDYGARRVERAADEIPNLEKLYKEEAIKQAFLGDNAKAVMTMNPKDFEKYAAPLDPRFMDANSTRYTTSGERLAYPDYMSEYLPNVGAFDDVPFLEINKKKQGSSTSPFISGHEGRHRNRVMANKGEEAGLVLLNPRAELREPFPRRSQEDYIEALKKELEITGNKVKPENYFDNFKQDVIERKPIILPDIYAKGGAVGQESPADMARFQKRFAMHKAIGGSVKKPQKFDGGGIASPEESSASSDSKPTKAGLMAEYLTKAAKDQGKEELSSLKKPRAATDILNRGVLANNPVSAVIDMVNMGLIPLDVLGSKLTGRDIKVSSDKPFLGSEHLKDLMNEYGVTSGEERPMMETALSFASPVGMIKGAQKTADLAKKAPEALDTVRGGLETASSNVQRPFRPATLTMEAVAPDLGQKGGDKFKDLVTKRMILGEGAPVGMERMGGRKTEKTLGQGLYENFAGQQEINPMVGITIPRAGNLSTNKRLIADIGTAGQELGQEMVAAHKFTPLMFKNPKDATAMMIGGSDSLTKEQILGLANMLPGMIVTHSPKNNAMFIAPFEGDRLDYKKAVQVASDILGKDAKIQFGKADSTKDIMFRGDYEKMGARPPSAESTEMRNRLKKAEERIVRGPPVSRSERQSQPATLTSTVR